MAAESDPDEEVPILLVARACSLLGKVVPEVVEVGSVVLPVWAVRLHAPVASMATKPSEASTDPMAFSPVSLPLQMVATVCPVRADGPRRGGSEKRWVVMLPIVDLLDGFSGGTSAQVPCGTCS